MAATLGERRTTEELSEKDVLETFSAYQPKTALMVAEEFGVEQQRAAELLDDLANRSELTKARAGTETPVWLRSHPR